MKKILTILWLAVTGLGFAQQYPDPYGTEYGTDYYSDYPDDYFYEYPEDYYPEDYYRSYYNDYRRSITGVNWNDLIYRLRLSPWQVEQLRILNRQYPTYGSWNSYYRINPDRWYIDRFMALQQILGPQQFVYFTNMYYEGYSPIVYFINYRRNYYVPRYRPIQRYRNVNVNVFYRGRSNHYSQGNRYTYKPSRPDGGNTAVFPGISNRNQAPRGLPPRNSAPRSSSPRTAPSQPRISERNAPVRVQSPRMDSAPKRTSSNQTAPKSDSGFRSGNFRG